MKKKGNVDVGHETHGYEQRDNHTDHDLYIMVHDRPPLRAFATAGETQPSICRRVSFPFARAPGGSQIDIPSQSLDLAELPDCRKGRSDPDESSDNAGNDPHQELSEIFNSPVFH